MGIKPFLVIKHLLGLAHLSPVGASHWDSNRVFLLITISIWCRRKQIHGHTHRLATLLFLEEDRGTDRKMQKGKAIVLTNVWASMVAQLVQSTCNAGDPGSIPGSGRSAGGGIGYPLQYFCASLVAQLVKNLPAMWETWVRSLGWEDLPEKGKATHSRILAWRFPWTV